MQNLDEGRAVVELLQAQAIDAACDDPAALMLSHFVAPLACQKHALSSMLFQICLLAYQLPWLRKLSKERVCMQLSAISSTMALSQL